MSAVSDEIKSLTNKVLGSIDLYLNGERDMNWLEHRLTMLTDKEFARQTIRHMMEGRI
jgi:hypothetical protein